jgi:hypothetical protein
MPCLRAGGMASAAIATQAGTSGLIQFETTPSSHLQPPCPV